MTTAEMLEARGEARGEIIGEARALIRTLTVRFGPLPESVPRKVRQASADQLERWSIRAVTVATLDEVFD